MPARKAFSPLFIAWEVLFVMLRCQQERIFRRKIKVWFWQPTHFFPVNNWVENRIVPNGRHWRTELWLYSAGQFRHSLFRFKRETMVSILCDRKANTFVASFNLPKDIRYSYTIIKSTHNMKVAADGFLDIWDIYLEACKMKTNLELWFLH